MNYRQIVVFGEVLFDCFPSGEVVPGGAPFNVAWHLQALGADPLFISRVGKDELGQKIFTAMNDWGMRTDGVQLDEVHKTGRVDVSINQGQPSYHISEDVAYDYISPDRLPADTNEAILYHGTLALRHTESRRALNRIAQRNGCSLFIDVNLRAPWWSKKEVMEDLQRARWAKMNTEELVELGFCAPDPVAAMAQLMEQCPLEQLIVTRGADGVLVRTRSGAIIPVSAPPLKRHIDTVGAGDAFSAVYLQGLMIGRGIVENITMAQQLAADIIGMRGATSSDRAFYNKLTTTG